MALCHTYLISTLRKFNGPEISVNVIDSSYPVNTDLVKIENTDSGTLIKNRKLRNDNYIIYNICIKKSALTNDLVPDLLLNLDVNNIIKESNETNNIVSMYTINKNPEIDYSYQYRKTFKLTENINTLYLPSIRYQLRVNSKTWDDDHHYQKNKFKVTDYNNDTQTFTIDKDIFSMDKYIQQTVDVTIEKKKIEESKNTNLEKYVLSNSNKYAVFINDSNRGIINKYDRITRFNQEIANFVNELELFYNTYHSQLYQVDTKYDIFETIKGLSNNVTAVVLDTTAITNEYTYPFNITIKGVRITVEDAILVNQINNSRFNSVKQDNLVYIYNLEENTQISDIILLKEAETLDSSNYISLLTINKLNLEVITTFTKSLKDTDGNIIIKQKISNDIYNGYVNSGISDLWLNMWMGMKKFLLLPTQKDTWGTIEELVSPFSDPFRGPINIRVLVESIYLFDSTIQSSIANPLKFRNNYLGINNDTNNLGITMYQNKTKYVPSEKEELSIEPYIFMNLDNDKDEISLLNNWSIIKNSVSADDRKFINLEENKINNVSSLSDKISFIVHNRIPRKSGKYYKANISLSKTTIEDIIPESQSSENIIKVTSTSRKMVKSSIFNNSIVNVFENGDIFVHDKLLNITSKYSFDLGNNIIELIPCGASSSTPTPTPTPTLPPPQLLLQPLLQLQLQHPPQHQNHCQIIRGYIRLLHPPQLQHLHQHQHTTHTYHPIRTRIPSIMNVNQFGPRRTRMRVK